MKLLVTILISLFLCCRPLIYNIVAGGCLPRKYDEDSVVCVCNEQYCDTLEPLGNFNPGVVKVYESGVSGSRLLKSLVSFNSTGNSFQNNEGLSLQLDPAITYQQLLGFGGAFTDSAGINIASLPEPLQDTLLKSYFSPQGSEYDIGRIPIASTDFSTREYSYDDVENDFDLEHFKLAEEDYKYKIPYIRKAMAISERDINFFATPWSCPFWMKTNEKMNGPGTLKDSPDRKYQKSYANYIVKYLQEYEKENITHWGLTVQNEPFDGYIPLFPFQALGFTAITQRDFVAQELGPALKNASYGIHKLKLMILDDQRVFMRFFANEVLSNNTAAAYVSGIAFHWYMNNLSPLSVLDDMHESYPRAFLLSTEACEGSNPLEVTKVALGSWARAESYSKDILQDLNHWTTGWVDWNLALDLEGGPNWAKNFVDSPIIVNATAKEFYKQPMYYALAHFSKFLPRGTSRISLTANTTGSSFDVGAFFRPDGATVLIALNRQLSGINLEINDPRYGVFRNILPPRSMQSYIWK